MHGDNPVFVLDLMPIKLFYLIHFPVVRRRYCSALPHQPEKWHSSGKRVGFLKSDN